MSVPDEGIRITFGEFEALTRRFANFLAREGVGPGDRISLLADNGIEPLVVFWGALRGGVIVNPINVEIREKHVSQILQDVAPALVFWSRALAGNPRALATGQTTWVPFGPWRASDPPRTTSSPGSATSRRRLSPRARHGGTGRA